MTTAELVAAVKAHAVINYEKDGWDYVVECWEDSKIAEVIGAAKTIKGAIAKVRAEVQPRAEYRNEIRSEIF